MQYADSLIWEISQTLGGGSERRSSGAQDMDPVSSMGVGSPEPPPGMFTRPVRSSTKHYDGLTRAPMPEPRPASAARHPISPVKSPHLINFLNPFKHKH